MKVLYIHQYFNTPDERGSLRSYYLSRELVKNGYQVTVITAHNQDHKIRKTVDGIQVIYLPVSYSNHMNFSKRGMAFIRFVILAILESMRQRKIDFCYVMTTPLSTGMVALFNKFILSRPYFFEVGDLWPQVPMDMGLLQGAWKQKLLTKLEGVFYRNARGLIGLSEPITSHLHSKVPNVPSQTVYNISDCERFVPSKKKDDLLEKYDVRNQFVISYTGTFGLANNLSEVIDFAKKVEDLPVKFLLVGDGAEKAKVVELIRRRGSANIRVYDSMSKSQLQEVINVTDAMFVSFAPYNSLHNGSPNKFFDALAAGKLVITNFGGWIGELITKEQCGFVAGKDESFRTQLIKFINNQKKLAEYKTNSRYLAEQRFDLKIQSKNQQEFIKQLFS